MERKAATVTMHGNPLALEGSLPAPGDPAPDAELLDNDLNPFRISRTKGRVAVISTVPSLDTPVCDVETRRFNQEAAALGERVEVLTVSMDLPFAQKRWCAAAGIDRVTTLSDHRSADSGKAYGVLIPDLRLLARCIFVVDAEGVVRYVQLVPEISEEPDYDRVIAEAGALL